MAERFVSRYGLRRRLSLQAAQLVYDLTVQFCNRYVSGRSETYDQLAQMAHTAVENIVEGGRASRGSKEEEVEFTRAARVNLIDLRLRYEDFLRERGLRLWDACDPRCEELIAQRPGSADVVAAWIRDTRERAVRDAEGRSGAPGRQGPSASSGPSGPATLPEIAANAALVLIAVARGVLDKQLAAEMAALEGEGGAGDRA